MSPLLRHQLLAARAQLDCQGEGLTPLLSAVGNGHHEATGPRLVKWLEPSKC